MQPGCIAGFRILSSSAAVSEKHLYNVRGESVKQVGSVTVSVLVRGGVAFDLSAVRGVFCTVTIILGLAECPLSGTEMLQIFRFFGG